MIRFDGTFGTRYIHYDLEVGYCKSWYDKQASITIRDYSVLFANMSITQYIHVTGVTAPPNDATFTQTGARYPIPSARLAKTTPRHPKITATSHLLP
jgi:hypothetical protein